MLQKNWQTLIKPKALSVEPGDDATRVATVTAEPLERGFGLTLVDLLAGQAGGEVAFDKAAGVRATVRLPD